MNKENEQYYACYVFEITIGASDPAITVGDIHNGFRRYCKKYVFQLERGTELTERNPEGYLHYQCRVTCIKKHRVNEVAKYLREECGWTKVNVQPTVTANKSSEAFYCMKADTRVDGPWKDTDYNEETPLPWPYNEITTLYPWQAKLRDIMLVRQRRIVNYVVEGKGCVGKTSIVTKLCCEDRGQRVPAMNSIEDMSAWVMSHKPNRMYIIDMPRAMPKKNMSGFFSGIEYLKDGYAYDKRYHGKERYFDSPNIVVFSNRLPNLHYLSRDRWKLWTIRNKELVPWGDYQAARESIERNGKDTTNSRDEAEMESEDDRNPEEEEDKSESEEADSSGSESESGNEELVDD